MIREENLKLNKSLEKAVEDQQKNSENLKVTKGQLEREKAKNKVMLKRLKAENSSNHNSADEGQSLPDVIWFDQKKVDQNLQKVDHNYIRTILCMQGLVICKPKNDPHLHTD